MCPFPEDRVDLSVFSPVCLPSNSADFIGHDGFVFGEQFFSFFPCIPFQFFSGWGETGKYTATDKLQETVVSFVENSNCAER